jgi:hypothetical protein
MEQWIPVVVNVIIVVGGVLVAYVTRQKTPIDVKAVEATTGETVGKTYNELNKSLREEIKRLTDRVTMLEDRLYDFENGVPILLRQLTECDQVPRWVPNIRKA